MGIFDNMTAIVFYFIAYFRYVFSLFFDFFLKNFLIKSAQYDNN